MKQKEENNRRGDIMLFDICSLTEKDVDKFIGKYGKIKDAETAIQMLILTPNAWHVLDDNLKMQNEIIMYYQPAISGRNISDNRYIAQKGFKNNEGMAIPNIPLPVDFDMTTYLNIQN